MYNLRDYQKEAIERMLWSLTLDGNSIVVIGQGGGKTHVISGFVEHLEKSVLILVPSKELLEQDLDKLEKVVDREEIGIFSASMNEKTIKKYTLATIQSAYKHPELFAHYDVVIIDEADLLNPKKLDGMYNKFFRRIGNPKIIGLTATPFRLDQRYDRWGQQKWMVNVVTITKMINRFYPFFWNRIIYTFNVGDLVRKGYLVPLTYRDVSIVSHEELETNKSKSEFDLENFELKVCNRYTNIAKFISSAPHNKKLVFCSSIKQAETLAKLTTEGEVVTAKTPKKKREEIISHFRNGKCNILYGVNIFAIGFDVPDVDCIVSLRPTRSLRLWTQVLGRGTRPSNGKETCYVYDFVGNVESLGTLESMKVKKVEDKWNVVTSARPDGFHNKGLFEYQLKAT